MLPLPTVRAMMIFARRIRRPEVKSIKRRLVWLLVMLPFLTGCDAVEGLGKLVDDLLKRFTG